MLLIFKDVRFIKKVLGRLLTDDGQTGVSWIL